MPTLLFRSSISRCHFECFFLEQLKAIFNKKVRTVAVQKRNISQDICDCLHQLTSDFWSFFPLSAHWFLNINNSHKTNIIIQLMYLIPIKWISESHYFLHLFTNPTSQHVPFLTSHISI